MKRILIILVSVILLTSCENATIENSELEKQKKLHLKTWKQMKVVSVNRFGWNNFNHLIN